MGTSSRKPIIKEITAEEGREIELAHVTKLLQSLRLYNNKVRDILPQCLLMLPSSLNAIVLEYMPIPDSPLNPSKCLQNNITWKLAYHYTVLWQAQATFLIIDNKYFEKQAMRYIVQIAMDKLSHLGCSQKVCHDHALQFFSFPKWSDDDIFVQDVIKIINEAKKFIIKDIPCTLTTIMDDECIQFQRVIHILNEALSYMYDYKQHDGVN